MSTYFNKGNPVLIGSLTPNSKANKSLAKMPNSKILSHTKLPPISNQNTSQSTSLLTSNSAKNSFHKPNFLSSNNSHSRNFYSTSSLDLGSLSDTEKMGSNTNHSNNIGNNSENNGAVDRQSYGTYSDIKPSLSANSNFIKQTALNNLNRNTRQTNVLINKPPSQQQIGTTANPYLANLQSKENRENQPGALSNVVSGSKPRLELAEPAEGEDRGYSEITKELDKLLDESSKVMKKNPPNLSISHLPGGISQTTKNTSATKVDFTAATPNNNLSSQVTPNGSGLVGRKLFQQSNRKAHHYSMNTRANGGGSLSESKHNMSSSIAISAGNLASNDIYISPEDLPKIESSKGSSQKNGIIKAYAANTHQGLVRNYNEDRVSIILNIMKPPNKEGNEWPTSSFFGIYDGHGGIKCAEFLRDNLHQYVIKDKNFPSNPRLAIRRGFEQAEKAFIEMAQGKNGELDKSGSCAVVSLIVDDICYIANVGDSRAVLSCEGGDKIFPLSKDHKPGTDEEQKRIISNGGKIYQSQIQTPSMGGFPPKIILGPFRVMPGRLSVSRTFGDAEAKLVKYGGNPNVIIAEPDIKSFKITDEKDFLILGCDGIFDKLSNKECIKSIWEVMPQTGRFKNIHEYAARSVENLIRESMVRRSLDNVTVVMICFKNLKKVLFPKSPDPSRNMLNQDRKLRNAQLFKEMQLVEYKYSPDNPNEPSDYDNDLYESATKGKAGPKDLMLSSGKSSGGNHHLSPRNKK